MSTALGTSEARLAQWPPPECAVTQTLGGGGHLTVGGGATPRDLTK